MRQLKEVFRLHYELKLSQRAIAQSTGLARSTVESYIQRAKKAELVWPLPEAMDEAALWQRLRLRVESKEPLQPERRLPDFAKIHQELRRKNVTLMLLWREYRQQHPDGYGRTQFFEHYRRWAAKLEPTLRQTHVPGEKLFVDWAGQSIPIDESRTEGKFKASIFVAVLGGSQKVFARAYENQKLPAWIDAHVKAFEFFGGVSKLVVPDNPKTAVTYPCRYEPKLHPTYQELATHYRCAILPARPRKPRDKALVESAVQIVQRQILAALRDRKFLSVTELNQALSPLLEKLNTQPFAKLPGSREERFNQQERGALMPLPKEPYELATWRKAKVNIDYHVAVDKHLYSVPHRFIHQEVKVRITQQVVEVYCQGNRIAAHARNFHPGKYTTVKEHLPKSHQKHLEWTPGRLISWGRSIGPLCARVIERIMKDRPHPEQGYRSCLGLLRLAKTVGEERMEAACDRAFRFGTCTYRSVKSILEHKLDGMDQQQQLPLSAPEHKNLRGADYYR